MLSHVLKGVFCYDDRCWQMMNEYKSVTLHNISKILLSPVLGERESEQQRRRDAAGLHECKSNV